MLRTSNIAMEEKIDEDMNEGPSNSEQELTQVYTLTIGAKQWSTCLF